MTNSSVMKKKDLIILSTNKTDFLMFLNQYVGKGRSKRFDAQANSLNKRKTNDTNFIYDFSWTFLRDTAASVGIYYDNSINKWVERTLEDNSMVSMASEETTCLEKAVADRVTRSEETGKNVDASGESTYSEKSGLDENERNYVIHVNKKLNRKKTSIDVDAEVWERYNKTFEYLKKNKMGLILNSAAFDCFISEYEAGRIKIEI